MKKLYVYFAGLLKTPTAEEIAAEDLERSKLMALKHKEQAEYHRSMTSFYEQQVTRLNLYVAQSSRGN